jgi:Cation efflux family
LIVKRDYLFRLALILSYITIFYNLLEGGISVFLGSKDEVLTLFGFGIDSFVEVIFGIGVWHMLKRIRENGMENRDDFEKRALRITGTSFYLLTAGLAATSVLNIAAGHKPETTFGGIIISIISIIAMGILMHYKIKTGKGLNSAAILADAACTKSCLYLSIILLITSAGYQFTGIGGIDSAGALLIAVFSFREGKESFEKARSGKNCGCGDPLPLS